MSVIRLKPKILLAANFNILTVSRRILRARFLWYCLIEPYSQVEEMNQEFSLFLKERREAIGTETLKLFLG